MSDTPVEILRATSVDPHPNADRLEIVKVLATQFVAQKGSLKAGDLVVYFPPEMLIPEDVAEKLGVVDYLKHTIYPGDIQKTKCRISAIRLRGVASFGFGLRLAGDDFPDKVEEGTDLTAFYRAVKYQPPPQFARCSGIAARQPAAFHQYTNIQHYYRYANDIKPGTPVRITEKIHGTNSRVGAVNDNGFELMCGSHKRRVEREGSQGRPAIYWLPLTDDMAEMLEFISINGQHNVIVFGEIYGRGVQKMDYGTNDTKGYRVIDISVDGEYQDWADVKAYCDLYGIPTVPLLYEGPFDPAKLEELTNGPTTLASPDDIMCKFKGREGVMITPLVEEVNRRGHRVILKSVSPDYHEAM